MHDVRTLAVHDGSYPSRMRDEDHWPYWWLDDSREAYRRVMADLIAHGAQGIILGCTEIALLVDQRDSTVPLFDTTSIHARKAAEKALLTSDR
jgi:Asp/Glu/hydantoin racemase